MIPLFPLLGLVAAAGHLSRRDSDVQYRTPFMITAPSPARWRVPVSVSRIAAVLPSIALVLLGLTPNAAGTGTAADCFDAYDKR